MLLDVSISSLGVPSIPKKKRKKILGAGASESLVMKGRSKMRGEPDEDRSLWVTFLMLAAHLSHIGYLSPC